MCRVHCAGGGSRPTRAPPTGGTGQKNQGNEVEEWLEEHQLGDYLKRVGSLGVRTLDDIRELDEQDMKSLKLNKSMSLSNLDLILINLSTLPITSPTRGFSWASAILIFLSIFKI